MLDVRRHQRRHGRGRRGERTSLGRAAAPRRAEDLRPRMEKFTQLTATACPINVANLNTDQLLPARYLKWPRSAGLGKVLFQDLRFDQDGRERAEFALN